MKNYQKYDIKILAIFLYFVFMVLSDVYSAPYKDATKPVEERISDLLSRMTLDEKVLQLCQYAIGDNFNINNIGNKDEKIPLDVGSLIYYSDNPNLRNAFQREVMEKSRLGIPVLFGFDVIHGFRTIFPIPLGQSCSWNKDLVEQACAVAAQETRTSGVEWTFSPMIDIARDGRWGRIAEAYGEDPYTNAVFCVSAVQGYQGKDLSSPHNIAACLKHFVGYGMSEGGRDYAATDISHQALWDTYLIPYQAGIQAGAATVMSAFNDISGIPASANYYTLTEILRNRWGFDGFVVSDWDAVASLIPQRVAANRKEAALKSFTAGVDMDMNDGAYREYLSECVKEGKISMKQIDQSVGRILELKFKLGLFEHPYTPESEYHERVLLDESKRIAARLAEESMVLLKNKNNRLPLSGVSKIALIGPMAKNKDNLLGSWSGHGRPDDVESIFEGMSQEFRGKTLLYAPGCDFDGEDASNFKGAVETAGQSDVIVLCLGEKRAWSGENASRSTLALPDIQEQLAIELAKTGKPIILVLSNGRPLELCRIEPLCDAIVEIWQPGIAGGTPLAGILSGRINPSGKLSVTFPLTTGQIPLYYNFRQSSRPHEGKYQDIPTEPLYEFGHGLSYTTFTCGDLKASSYQVKSGDKIEIEIPVSNTGATDGSETVHWFISDPYCSISRPVKELKYFEKRHLKAGETCTFKYSLDVDSDLGFTDSDGKRFVEPGDFYIMVKDKKIKIEVEENPRSA
jgi:beta-glucosidase